MSVTVIDDGRCSKHDRELDACSDCMLDALADPQPQVKAWKIELDSLRSLQKGQELEVQLAEVQRDEALAKVDELKVEVVAMRDRVVLERERREELGRLLAKALYLDGTGRSLDQTHVTQDVYLRAEALGIDYKSFSSSSSSESAP